MVQVVTVNSENWDAYMDLRHHVFCVERNVPEEIQIDGYDTLTGCAEHFMILKDGTAAGAFRCRPEGDLIHLQRFCVLASQRKQGLGRAMLRYAQSRYQALGYQKLVFEAKYSAKPFYEKCGCITVSDIFIEVGLPHVKMELPLQENS
jgi:predicted GNAT family N-acyltransferase